MSSNKPPSELGTAVNELMPYFRQAALFSVFAQPADFGTLGLHA
jgi:hypothetical protein